MRKTTVGAGAALAAMIAASVAFPSAAATAGTRTAGHAGSAGGPAAAAKPGPTTDPGFPVFVHLPADQAAHPNYGDEWWYTVGHLQAAGHEYGYEVNLTSTGAAQISLTDVTAGTYASEQTVAKPGQFSISASRLNVQMPTASLSGPPSQMHLTADLPHAMGTLDLTLEATGPTLYPNGTGLFPFLGGTSYYYSLPHLRTSGTLNLHGAAEPVTGVSWLDRQWGDWDWSKLHRWTWMAIQLDNGQALNLWDVIDSTGEHVWATVLSPDGSERVVAVTPLAPDASRYQTSPATGQRYAGQWLVKIPGLHAALAVSARPVLQEIQTGVAGSPGINESDASVRGTYLGQPVTGKAYVEQLGHWR